MKKNKHKKACECFYSDPPCCLNKYTCKCPCRDCSCLKTKNPNPSTGWEKRFDQVYGRPDDPTYFIDDEQRSLVKGFIKPLLKETREESVRETEKKIRKKFIDKFKGAGEVWFPYVSEGNCTEEEELEAVNNEWNDVVCDCDFKWKKSDGAMLIKELSSFNPEGIEDRKRTKQSQG